MPTHKTSLRKPAQSSWAVVQPVAKRLSRIEAMLHEMRFEQEVQTKRINALRSQFDELTETRTLRKIAIRGQAKSKLG
jgi:hypothetical protein